MRSESLRNKITIQQQTNSQDSSGQLIPMWSNFVTVWASVEPISGREFFAADRLNSQITTRIRIRYLSGIIPAMRCVFGTHIYEIQSVIDIEVRHKEIELMCSDIGEVIVAVRTMWDDSLNWDDTILWGEA